MRFVLSLAIALIASPAWAQLSYPGEMERDGIGIEAGAGVGYQVFGDSDDGQLEAVLPNMVVGVGYHLSQRFGLFVKTSVSVVNFTDGTFDGNFNFISADITRLSGVAALTLDWWVAPALKIELGAGAAFVKGYLRVFGADSVQTDTDSGFWAPPFRYGAAGVTRSAWVSIGPPASTPRATFTTWL